MAPKCQWGPKAEEDKAPKECTAADQANMKKAKEPTPALVATLSKGCQKAMDGPPAADEMGGKKGKRGKKGKKGEEVEMLG